MATITFKLEDIAGDEVRVFAESDPPLTEEAKPTPAQILGVKMLEWFKETLTEKKE